MGELTALRERVEAIERGNRHLDAEIEVVIRDREAARSGVARQYWSEWKALSNGMVTDGQGCLYPSQCVTSQVGCAMRAVHRAIPDCWLRVDFQKDRAWRCELADNTEWTWSDRPEIAILAALLAALEQDQRP